MDRAEFSRAMAVLTAGLNIRMPEQQAEVYYAMLGDLSVQRLEIAVKRVLLEHRISTLPTVAEIRALAVESGEQGIDPADGLRIVREAVRVFGWPRPSEALASLPPLVRRVVQAIGWDEICSSENPEALRAHFFRLIESVSRREHRERLLPQDLQRQIEHERNLVGADRSLRGLDSILKRVEAEEPQ